MMKPLKSALAALAALAGLALFAPTASAEALEPGNARGMCLDFASGRGVLSRCTGDAPQDLDIPKRGANFIRVGRYCVAAASQGAQLYATNCRNRAEQYWTYSQNGTLVNGSGLCADVEGGSRYEGARVIAYNCSGKSNQRFDVWQGGYDPGPGNGGGYQARVLLSPTHAPGMCLDRDKSSNQIILFGCHGKSNQVFTLSQSGRTEIKVNNGCLTASGSNRSPVYAATCNGRREQTWVVMSNRTIRNDASGLCLDVDGAGRYDRTPVITYKCSGKSNQRFNFYSR